LLNQHGLSLASAAAQALISRAFAVRLRAMKTMAPRALCIIGCIIIR
jgi:hypothetical protein